MSKIIVNHNIKSTSSLEVVKDKKGILKDNIITYNHNGVMIRLKLLENKIFFPMDEATQSRIAKVFELTDHEIDLLQKSIEAEKQKKKALMQLLITGKVRRK